MAYSIDRMALLARSAALEAEGVGKRRSYRLGAVLFDDRGRVWSVKTNKLKTHPVLAKYTQFPYLHAETACVLGHGLDNCNGMNIMVVRVLRDGTPAISNPCCVCRDVMSLAGIHTVYYYGKKGMTHEHLST